MFFYLFATLLNDEVCNNGNAMKQCNFQNNYGVIAYRKICSCSSIFKFSYRPPEFSLRGKFIPKITIFGDLRGCKPTFFKAKTVKFGIRVRTWDSHPMQNFVKNHLRGYTPLGKFIQKIPILAILGLKAHTGTFKAKMVKFGVMVRTWDSLAHTKFGKNRLREYTHLG